jgi:hypothetical protein
VVVNAARAPFGSPDRQLMRTQAFATMIDSASGAESYALWLLADDDSDGAYRFQLERIGHPPTRPDEALPRQLFVVCQRNPCDVDHVRAAVGPEWTASRIDWLAEDAEVRLARLGYP